MGENKIGDSPYITITSLTPCNRAVIITLDGDIVTAKVIVTKNNEHGEIKFYTTKYYYDLNNPNSIQELTQKVVNQ